MSRPIAKQNPFALQPFSMGHHKASTKERENMSGSGSDDESRSSSSSDSSSSIGDKTKGKGSWADADSSDEGTASRPLLDPYRNFRDFQKCWVDAAEYLNALDSKVKTGIPRKRHELFEAFRNEMDTTRRDCASSVGETEIQAHALLCLIAKTFRLDSAPWESDKSQLLRPLYKAKKLRRYKPSKSLPFDSSDDELMRKRTDRTEHSRTIFLDPRPRPKHHSDSDESTTKNERRKRSKQSKNARAPATSHTVSSGTSGACGASAQLTGSFIECEDVTCEPPPARKVKASFLPVGCINARTVAREYKVDLLQDVLAYMEGTAYNMYKQVKGVVPRRAEDANVEYETFLYDKEDKALLDTALFRTLTTLAAKLAESGATELFPSELAKKVTEKSSVAAAVAAPEPASSRQAAAAVSSNARAASAIAPNFVMPGSTTTPAPETSAGYSAYATDSSSETTSVFARLPQDDPGRLRVSTVLKESGIENAVLDTLQGPDKFEVLKQLRMKTGLRMRKLDSDRGIIRRREGSYFLYAEEDRASLKECAFAALDEINALLNVNIRV